MCVIQSVRQGGKNTEKYTTKLMIMEIVIWLALFVHALLMRARNKYIPKQEQR